MLDKKLMQTSKQFVTIMRQLQNSKNWKIYEDTDVKAYTMSIDNRVVMRADVTINHNIQIVADFFADSSTIKVTSNDALKKYQLLQSKNGLQVFTAAFYGYYPVVADRQIIAINTINRQKNRIYVGTRSCNYYLFEKDPHSVLAQIHVAGYILQKINDNRTRLIHLADADPCGAIPYYISNLFATKRVAIVRLFEQKIRQWGQNNGKILMYS